MSFDQMKDFFEKEVTQCKKNLGDRCINACISARIKKLLVQRLKTQRSLKLEL